MPSDSSNDNARQTAPARDAITVADAVEIVDVAAEVKADVGHDRGECADHQRHSLELLTAISSSLRRDLPVG